MSEFTDFKYGVHVRCGRPVCEALRPYPTPAAIIDCDHATITRLEKALRLAVSTIEGLAGQQAMDDDWYVPKLAEIRAALTE